MQFDGWASKGRRRSEDKGPVEEYFDQFAENAIFVNIMKSNLETTIHEVENSTQKLSYKISQQQLLEMKYRLVDLLSTFQSYKLEFSTIFDKIIDFYLMGTATDPLTEDHFENIASFGMYSDVFYHVLRFKVLRDLYSINARDATNASWPADLGDIPPDGIVGELSNNVMAALGDVLGVSKYVQLIFGKQLPIQNGPEFDNAYPGTVYKLMTSTKYYIKSLVSYKLFSTTNTIKHAKVDLSGNVVNILSTLAKHRILNTLVHKTILRIFARLKDMERFMKTGEKGREAPISKRYFEPILENSISPNIYKKRREESVADTEIGLTSSSSDDQETPPPSGHVSKRFIKDPELILLMNMYKHLYSHYNAADVRKDLSHPESHEDGQDEKAFASPKKTGNIINWNLNGETEEPFLETNIIFKTRFGLKVIGDDDPRYGHSIGDIRNELKQVSKVIGYHISTYLGQIIVNHFIRETFGYEGSGVNQWVRFMNSGNMSGGNALIGNIEEFYSAEKLEKSISQILKSFGLVGKFYIDQNAVRAQIKASMPFSFEGILEHLKTFNHETSRTFVRFKNLMSIMEVVKIKLSMEKIKISDYVNNRCAERADYGDNLYLNFLKYRRHATKLDERLSEFMFSNVLHTFKDGNVWLEDFYSSDSASVVTQEFHSSVENLVRKYNASRDGDYVDSRIFDSLADMKKVDSFLNRCYFSFVSVVCDPMAEKFAEPLPEILLRLITGFVEAEILPDMCKEYDYVNGNFGKSL